VALLAPAVTEAFPIDKAVNEALRIQMDSKDVNQAIRRLIRPFLKERGFDTSTARWIWRHQEHTIDCIHFWSPFNWVQAAVYDITTFSFQIDLGIYFTDIPPEGPGPKEKRGHLLPEDSECHIRRHLRPPAEQQKVLMPWLWYIDPNGTNLEETVDVAKEALERDALPWFDLFMDRKSFFRLLLVGEGQGNEEGWGYGAPNSQSRNYKVGYLAKSLGYNEMAITHLEAYLESARELGKLGLGAYALIHERVELDIAVMRSRLGLGNTEAFRQS
jgi:hypothetical protein